MIEKVVTSLQACLAPTSHSLTTRSSRAIRPSSAQNLSISWRWKIRFLTANDRLTRTHWGGCSPSRPSDLGLWKGRAVSADAALEADGLDKPEKL